MIPSDPQANHSEHEHSELTDWDPRLEIEAVRVTADGANPPQSESISLASVWQLDSPSAADAALGGTSDDFVYRRVDHPNARSLANKLAKLHGGCQALITAQGMSAIAAMSLAILKPGAMVWIGEELYGETSKLFTQNLERWDVHAERFDPCCSEDVQRLRQSRVDLVFAETITNPRLKVANIRALADATHQAGGLLAVDNTFATYLLCRPLDLGADFVVESLGKQTNGHSDTMLGLLCGKQESTLHSIAQTIKTFGMASSPMDCYLTHRGILSLAVRMQRACENALALAQAMLDQPGIACVDYPGLSQHASHGIAKKQLRGGFGWMLSFQLANASRATVDQFLATLRPEICFVPSLGDITTTISHPASTSHRSFDPQERSKLGIEVGTIRVSCGIEPTGWLIDHFVSAIAKLQA